MNFKNDRNNVNDNDNRSDDNNYCILFNKNDYLWVIKVIVRNIFLSILVRIDRILLFKTIIKYIILFFYLIRKILTKKTHSFFPILNIKKR